MIFIILASRSIGWGSGALPAKGLTFLCHACMHACCRHRDHDVDSCESNRRLLKETIIAVVLRLMKMIGMKLMLVMRLVVVM